MSETGTISDIELLAFVDGKLSPETARYREIENILQREPALAARVAAYRQQNAALTQAYGHIAEQPAPAHLLHVLQRNQDQSQRRFAPRLRVAASLAAVMLSGGLGWYAGGLGDRANMDATALMEMASESYTPSIGGDLASRIAAPSPDGQGVALDGTGPVDRASLEIPAPDLSDEGFNFVARDRITRRDRDLLALTYRNPDGDNVRILIAPRFSQPRQPIRMERQGDLSMGYWTEGGLAIALIGRLETDDTRALAERVRRKTTIRLADELPAPVIRHAPIEQEASAQGASDGTQPVDAAPSAQPVSSPVPEGG